MERVRYTLTGEGAVGLFFIQRYGFLTIEQFARVSGLPTKPERFLGVK